MIEAVIIAMILSGVVLKVGGNVAVDVAHAVRGKESPRYKQAKARSWMPKKPSGAASRYWSQLWEDSWTRSLVRHNRRVERRNRRPPATIHDYWIHGSLLGRRVSGNFHNRIRRAFTRLENRYQSRTDRVPAEPQVVPGEVVPDAPVPAEPEPVLVDQPDSRTDLQFGTDPTDPNGTQYCPSCGGELVVDGEICGACQYRQQQRTKHWESQDTPSPSTTPDPTPVPDDTPQEGTATMTATTTEVSGLSSILMFTVQGAEQFRANVTVAEGRAASCRQDAAAYKQMVTATELAVSAAQAGGVSGEAVVRMAQSMEKATTAAAAMEKAEAEFATAQEQAGAAAADLEASASAFRQHLGIQEQYNQNHGAGTREFITANQ
jgi:hypothetical protein